MYIKVITYLIGYIISIFVGSIIIKKFMRGGKNGVNRIGNF